VKNCVICNSTNLKKSLGQIAPFIAHKILDYPLCYVNYGDKTMFPILLANGVLCNDCGFVFSQVRFDDEEMSAIYSGYRGEAYVKTRSYFEPGYDKINSAIGSQYEIENRQIAISEFLADVVDFSTVKTVLDYGGDKGQHIPRAFKKCSKFVYDVSNVGVVDGVVVVSDLSGLGFMDFVMAANVFEHIPYPNSVIQHIKSVCSKGTTIFIDVPLELDEIDVAQGGDLPSYFHEHINFFSRHSLRYFLNHNGFQVLKIEVVSIDCGWARVNSIYAAAVVDW
jgi:Methyltransferase domain